MEFNSGFKGLKNPLQFTYPFCSPAAASYSRLNSFYG